MDQHVYQDSDIVTKKAATLKTQQYFYVGMALYLILVVFAGFWPTYFGPVTTGQEPAQFGALEISGIIHIHATVFVGWMILFLTQATLILREQSEIHMKIGRYGMIFGAIVTVIGLIMTFTQAQKVVSMDITAWDEVIFLVWPSVVSIGQFAILLILGYRYRNRPEFHKRFMLLATVAIVQAATSRMRIFMGPWSIEIMVPFLVGPLFIYDYYTQKRIHRATLIGTGVVLLFFVFKFLMG